MRHLDISSLTDVELMLAGGFFFAVRQSNRTSAVDSMHINRRSAISRSRNMDEVVDLMVMQDFLSAHKKEE